MCTAQLALGFTTASGVASAVGGQASADSTASYYNYLGDLDRIQAGIVEREGERKSTYTQDEAARKAGMLRQGVNGILGSQIAVEGAAGIAGATAEDIAFDTLTKSQKDEAAIKYTADIASYEATESAKATAMGLRNRAAGYDAAAGNARTAGRMNFWSSILGTAAMAGTNYLKMKDVGVIGGSTFTNKSSTKKFTPNAFSGAYS